MAASAPLFSSGHCHEHIACVVFELISPLIFLSLYSSTGISDPVVVNWPADLLTPHTHSLVMYLVYSMFFSLLYLSSSPSHPSLPSQPSVGPPSPLSLPSYEPDPDQGFFFSPVKGEVFLAGVQNLAFLTPRDNWTLALNHTLLWVRECWEQEGAAQPSLFKTASRDPRDSTRDAIKNLQNFLKNTHLVSA